MENLHLLFYKTMYEGLSVSDEGGEESGGAPRYTLPHAGEVNRRICAARFAPEDSPVSLYENVLPVTHLLRLKTVYPGLLVGLGHTHGINAAEDTKIGFSFDYVTGQPYIPGSSMKGFFRSFFAFPEVINELGGWSLSDEELKRLEADIFDGGDTFFDAVVVSGGRDGRLIDNEYITPHPTPSEQGKEPRPIRMLKVVPDVVLAFAFTLSDSAFCGKTVTANRKMALFKSILLHFGVGAKTNEGYGILDELKQDRTQVVCPFCLTKNFRYARNGAENKRWASGICYKCGGKLPV